MMTEQQLADLKFGAIKALGGYIDELQRSKEVLGRIIAPSPELTSLLAAQRNAESRAYAEYQQLRQALFNAPNLP